MTTSNRTLSKPHIRLQHFLSADCNSFPRQRTYQYVSLEELLHSTR